MSKPSPTIGVPGRRVVLLHGLSRRPASMRRMAEALHAAGYEVLNRGYASRRKAVATLGEELRRWLADEVAGGGAGPVHFVTHSLGGILLRSALRPPAPLPVGRIVMLAPPNQGVGGLVRWRRSPLPGWIYGRPALELYQGAPLLAALPVPETQIGVIAGTGRLSVWNPNSWLNAAFGGAVPSDGTVEVENTRVAAAHEFITVPATHSLICANPRAIAQTIAYLQTGRFRDR